MPARAPIARGHRGEHARPDARSETAPRDLDAARRSGRDYAWAVFAKAETLRPGAKATLESKALPLVGGPESKPLVPGHGQVQGVFLADRADMMLGYCSSSPAVMRDVPGLVSIPLPPALTVGPAYGMIVLTDNPLADRFAVFVMSEHGQAILAHDGFVPVATP
ncbi:MAG: substrate-binding domain-containing protein [Acetobacteraceae bacterium]